MKHACAASNYIPQTSAIKSYVQRNSIKVQQPMVKVSLEVKGFGKYILKTDLSL